MNFLYFFLQTFKISLVFLVEYLFELVTNLRPMKWEIFAWPCKNQQKIWILKYGSITLSNFEELWFHLASLVRKDHVRNSMGKVSSPASMNGSFQLRNLMACGKGFSATPIFFSILKISDNMLMPPFSFVA